MLYIGSIFWMVFLFIDINMYKKVEQKLLTKSIHTGKDADDDDDNDRGHVTCGSHWISKRFKKVKQHFLKYILDKYDRIYRINEKQATTTQSTDAKMTGYFYDYKFGASGLYLKVGLGGMMMMVVLVTWICRMHMSLFIFCRQSVLHGESDQLGNRFGRRSQTQ
jgi:hypothetical protein